MMGRYSGRGRELMSTRVRAMEGEEGRGEVWRLSGTITQDIGSAPTHAIHFAGAIESHN